MTAPSDRPLRVAMLTQRYLPFTGGAERQLAAILRRLPEYGIEATVITRRHDDSPTRAQVEGVAVERIGMRGARVRDSLGYTAQALGLLHAFRPAVVHAHELLSPSTTAVAYRALTGTPVVAKVLRGGVLGDVAVLERGRLGRARLRRLLPRIDAFAVISGEIDAELAGLGVGSDRRHFIPNGVDLSRYRPAEAAERPGLRARLGLPEAPVALFAGRLEEEKQVDRLVALWPRVRAAVPGATLVVAGTGTLAPVLRATAGEGVRLVGPQKDLRDWYAAADLFALPSRAEGLSNAMLEAMAMGLPCVATRVGAAPELLTPELGRLVDVQDDEGLAEALVEGLCGLPGHRPERSRDVIARSYGIDVTAARLARLYRNLSAPRR